MLACADALARDGGHGCRRYGVQDAKEQLGGPPERAAGHAGRLIRKLALVFLAFAAVAVALNCALTYVSTRDTFLDTEADRLRQVGDYAANASQAGMLPEYFQAWQENAGDLDPSVTYEQQLADLDEWSARHDEEIQRMNDARDVSDEAAARVEEINEEYHRKTLICQYYSLAEMLDRLRASFNVSRLALMVPDAQGESVFYVMEGVTDQQARANGDVRFFGDVEQRTRDGYEGLWAAVETGGPSSASSLAPDGTSYSVYVPLAVGDETWVYEVSMGTDELEAAVWSQMAGTLVVSCAVFAVCLTAMLLVLRRTLVKPLAALSARVREYASSKSASVSSDIRGSRYPKDEVGDLAADTADMIDELQAHMDDIARMGAERERTRSELAVASRIQLSALPAVRPPFSGCEDFGLSASMRPAKEVGGDFYDFFLIDEDHCGVVIADVSGKGVPAALFMMRVKALLNQLMRDDAAPDRVLAQANDSLCEDNEAGMFVTVWLGVLDLRTGELSFANGGHNPPLYRHADGSVEWLRDRSGLLLGCFEGSPYHAFARTMAPGDALVLYTDGVTEAMDASDRCYGNDRLLHLVEQRGDGYPAAVSEAIEEDVRSFAEGAEQADDITLLVLRYDGKEGRAIAAAGRRG